MASSSRTYQTLNNNKEEEEEEDEWLKLGLGLGGGGSSSTSSWKKIVSNPPCSQIGLGLGFEEGSDLGTKNGKEGLGGSPSSLLGLPSSSDHCSKDHYYHHHHHHNDVNGMVLWPSSSSSCQIDHVPCGSHHYSARNPHQSGLWFTLISFTNRNGEALPQIPKAYIRVKDENMTVLMVKKYLVTKLGLSNEAEVDISCMGQSLSHLLTLKQIRDTIWLPRLVESVNSTTLSFEDTHDMSMNHIMSLLYRKHCILN